MPLISNSATTYLVNGTAGGGINGVIVDFEQSHACPGIDNLAGLTANDFTIKVKATAMVYPDTDWSLAANPDSPTVYQESRQWLWRVCQHDWLGGHPAQLGGLQLGQPVDDRGDQRKWLQMTAPGERRPIRTRTTGLAVPDVFYFGSAPGDSGNSTTDTRVNATDEVAARNDPHNAFNRASITDPQ